MPGDDADDFISFVPGQGEGGPGGGLATADGAASAAAPEAANADRGAEGGAAERAITEADIIQLDGNRLYALSRYAGLNIIDVSDPSDLKVLGRVDAHGNPFEMYLQDGVAYVMYNDYEQYIYDDEIGGWSWQSSSQVEAYDVSEPAMIASIGGRQISGRINDSRMVGDILYVVTSENGWCWRCEPQANTRVVSFDASDVSQFDVIDELRFMDSQEAWSRSIAVTTERIYVGGPTWSDRDSNITVVDISDPAGSLELGDEVAIRGSIESRWQMDEYDGILRVVSQPTPWRSDAAPYVQTYRINSSFDVEPIASVPVVLPRPEDLRSVRFDGDRAYVVTFEQIDPLFTFDLSDPANPRQMGELEIPGFVYHMEPRGDRVYGLGFDWTRNDQGQNEAGGALHVSIFDVSDLSNPTMLDRVNFGGDWANVAEDQDRIHKAFNIMLDEGLILVPFGGGEHDQETCNYRYQSGIQLIDVDGDDLTLRGVAGQLGEARRSILHQGNIIGVTDNAVQTFDIADRDDPTQLDMLEVARNIQQVHVMGDSVMRFGQDWWTQRAILDFTNPTNASTPEPLGEVNVADALAPIENQCNSHANWEGNVYVHGDTAYVARRRYEYDSSAAEYNQRSWLEIYVVDLTDRENPTIAGMFETDKAMDEEYIGGIVLTDSALLIGRGKHPYYYWRGDDGERPEPEYAYDIYDLSNPLTPELTTRFSVPSQIAGGGWGYGPAVCGMDMAWGWWFPGQGSSGALVAGDLVVSQHEETVDDGTGRVRYYMDRLDVSDPAAPRLLPKVNIPGQIAHVTSDATRVITLDYVYEDLGDAKDWEACYNLHPGGIYDYRDGSCARHMRRANALVIDGDTARRVSMQLLDTAERGAGFVAVTDTRLFWMSYEHRGRDAGAVSIGGPGIAPNRPDISLEALAYNSAGQFVRLPGTELEKSDGGYWNQVYARKNRAFVTRSRALDVVDTGDLNKPTVKSVEMRGWGCSSLEVRGDRAFCAQNQYGVLTIDL